jgi:hypothetical protein
MALLPLLEPFPFSRGSRWGTNNAQAEPIIGSPDCPVLAELYGERGISCYVMFVWKKVDGTYGCRHERYFRVKMGTKGAFRSARRLLDFLDQYVPSTIVL